MCTHRLQQASGRDNCKRGTDTCTHMIHSKHGQEATVHTAPGSVALMVNLLELSMYHRLTITGVEAAGLTGDPALVYPCLFIPPRTANTVIQPISVSLPHHPPRITNKQHRKQPRLGNHRVKIDEVQATCCPPYTTHPTSQCWTSCFLHHRTTCKKVRAGAGDCLWGPRRNSHPRLLAHVVLLCAYFLLGMRVTEYQTIWKGGS